MSSAFDPITAIDDALDGSITPDTHAALDAWLTASPANAQLFTSRARLHRNLHAAMGHVAIAKPVEATEPSEESFPIYRKGHEPKPQMLHPRHYAVAGIAAALLAACGVAVYLLAFNAPPIEDQPDPNQPGPAVATLIQNTGTLTTPHGFPAEGDDYGRGEYTLSSGSAEFMLTNAVNVKLRGRARMVMRSNSHVELARGSARFVVPQDASGFTVHLPDRSKIVDLGTAFGVDVDDYGRTRLRVTEGSVHWFAAGPDAEPVLIVAGQSAHLEGGQPVVLTPADLRVAHWEFDHANAIGKATVGSDLRVVGGAAYSADGRVGGALRLDGVDDYLRVDAAYSLPADLPTGDSSYTIAAWINPASTGIRGIIGWGAYEASGRVNALRLQQANGLRNYWWGELEGYDLIAPDAGVPLTAGEWVHVAVTYDGTTRRLYVNGKSIAHDTPPAPNVASEQFTLGVTNHIEFFHGLIDDVAIYNAALNAAEINSEMNKNPAH